MLTQSKDISYFSAFSVSKYSTSQHLSQHPEHLREPKLPKGSFLPQIQVRKVCGCQRTPWDSGLPFPSFLFLLSPLPALLPPHPHKPKVPSPASLKKESPPRLAHREHRWSRMCTCAQSLVMLESSWPRGLQPARLLCPWEFPGRNTGVGCHFLLQGIFLTQASNPRLLHHLHWQVDSLPLSHLGSPLIMNKMLQLHKTSNPFS